MLTNLQLTNFRRHRDLTLDFTQGMQVIRAANEGGKTTTTEAFAYALFGSSALRTTFDETVTWNEPASSLKVKVELQVGGDTLVFSRSKSGAEVIKNGSVFVTGQKEVSSFASALLGADSGVAHKLFLSGQNSIRGALEEGPKALSVLIEDLAGFEMWDRILNAAQEKLALGNPALLEERLKGAESTLAAASENLPAQPDAEAHAAKLVEIDAEMKANLDALPAAQTKVTVATAAYDTAVKQYGERMQLQRTHDDAVRRLNDSTVQEESLRADAQVVVADRRDSLRATIAEAENHANRAVAFRFYKDLPTGPRFGGSSDEFQTALTTARNELAEVERAIKTLDMREVQTKARRINHDKCDKCGQDVTHLESVVTTNKLVDAELAEIEALRVPYLARKPGITDRLAALEETDNFARKYSAAVGKVASYVTLDCTVYPPKAEWVGGVPAAEAVDVDGLRGQLKRNEAALSAATSAKAKHEMAIQSLAKAKADVVAATAKLNEFVAPTSEEVVRLEEAKNEAVAANLALKGSNILLQQSRDAEVSAFNSATTVWAMSRARIEDAEKTIAACKSDLDSLAFNNALVKKLRSLRPLVADQLWNTVLASVSVMFSQMRGEASIVTKGKDGFRVNGQAVESLSGSTLDLLGLALRCSLLKTFVPHCDLLVLDEAAAAMDSSRTEAMMGFIKSAGFGQTILITHESVSSTICDNILEI